LAEHHGSGVKILGGGTDLLVDVRGKIIPDQHRPRCQEHRDGPWLARYAPTESIEILLALSRITELRGIAVEVNCVRIGAMTTITDLERSPVVRTRLAGLWDGARQLGSPLVRNRGTYGGNLCNARPAADTAIPTLALGGRLVLASIRGERTVDHSDFVTGPGETILEPDEILKEVVFDLANDPAMGSAYLKLSNRKALEIAVVSAAAMVTFNSPPAEQGGIKGGVTKSARIALGAVAPTPLLVPEAGEALVGKELDSQSISEAARIAAGVARPITDHRGGDEYRRMMVEVLVRRVLMSCWERALAGTVEEAA